MNAASTPSAQLRAWMAVLTPSFGYGRFIGDAVRSVAEQKRDDVMHVVTDGGSADDTVEALRRLQWRGLAWDSRPDAGQSDALNRALSMTESEWVGWLNADEFYLPGAVDAVAAWLGRHPGADVVYGDVAFVDERGSLMRLVPQHPFSAAVLRNYGCYIGSCATFIRRESLVGVGPAWDPSLRRIMDWDVWLRLWQAKATFSYLPVPLSAFRVHGDQVTSIGAAVTSAEYIRVRAKHGLPLRAPVIHGMRVAGAVLHRALKVQAGSHRRQKRVARLQGADLRWFDSTAAAQSAMDLVATGSASGLRASLGIARLGASVVQP